jgi:phosphate transport system substrate-binding protein
LATYTYYPFFFLPGETMKRLTVAILITLLMGAIFTSAAFAKENVRISGSTTVFPLAEADAEAFNGLQSDYNINVNPGGTGVGIKDVATGNSNIGMASREVTVDEIKQFGDEFKENLVGFDGIVIAVNKDIYDAGVKALTKDQVKKIYNGNITNWKELGGPDKEIWAIVREAGSGTRDTFNEDIMGDKKAETPGLDQTANGNFDVLNTIKGTPASIGYLGFSYVRGGDVGVITMDGITPTAQSIKDGSYELSRELYFYFFGTPTPGAKAFTDFVKSSEGQKIAEENGFVPL